MMQSSVCYCRSHWTNTIITDSRLDLPTNSLLCDLFYSQSRQQTREAKPPRTHKHTRYSQTHSIAASQLR